MAFSVLLSVRMCHSLSDSCTHNHSTCKHSILSGSFTLSFSLLLLGLAPNIDLLIHTLNFIFYITHNLISLKMLPSWSFSQSYPHQTCPLSQQPFSHKAIAKLTYSYALQLLQPSSMSLIHPNNLLAQIHAHHHLSHMFQIITNCELQQFEFQFSCATKLTCLS